MFDLLSHGGGLTILGASVIRVHFLNDELNVDLALRFEQLKAILRITLRQTLLQEKVDRPTVKCNVSEENIAWGCV